MASERTTVRRVGANAGASGAASNAPLFWSVFFLFAPIGVLTTFFQEEPVGWAVAVVGALIGGTIALGWAYAFSTRRWWLLVPLLIAPMFLPRYVFQVFAELGLLKFGYGMPPTARKVVLFVMIVAMTSVGFVLLVGYIRLWERRSARARAELELGRRIHAAVVPSLALRAAGVEVVARSEASSEMGGDLVDAVRRRAEDGAEELDVFVADVSGHGVAAGLVMGMVKSAIRTRLRAGASLDELVRDLNLTLGELMAEGMFVTLACVRVRGGGPGPREAEFALAGHLSILHFVRATGEVRELPNEALPLGVLADEAYRSGRVAVSAGDVLAVFTDGLTEVQDARGKELGFAAQRACLREACVGAGADGAAIADALLARARAHGPQLDDQSVLVVRVL
jgi:serine phosphatase RsbU (regulator of sigma subunit)